MQVFVHQDAYARALPKPDQNLLYTKCQLADNRVTGPRRRLYLTMYQTGGGGGRGRQAGD